MSTPDQIVQRQFDAYNAKDVVGWLATYHPDAEQFALHGERLAQGHAELRSRIQVRFSEPNLHARLLSRTVMGNVVVDHELISRTFPEGPGQIEMLCIHEVAGEAIIKATFAVGNPTLVPSTKSAA